MDDRARRILDEARATLARVANIEVEHRDVSKPDPLLEWRAGMAPAEKTLTADATERKISDATEAQRELLIDVMARGLASERKLHRSEIAKVRAELRKLVLGDRRLARNELNSQRASLGSDLDRLRTRNAALEVRIDGLTTEAKGRIIDLPSVPLRGGRRG